MQALTNPCLRTFKLSNAKLRSSSFSHVPRWWKAPTYMASGSVTSDSEDCQPQ